MSTTQATLFLFQIGPKILFPNLAGKGGRITGSFHIETGFLSGGWKHLSAPSWRSGLVPKNHQVLHHLLAQVVVYAVDLILCEEGGEMDRKLLGALKVTSEWLLHYHPTPASTTQMDTNDSLLHQVAQRTPIGKYMSARMSDSLPGYAWVYKRVCVCDVRL